MECRTLPTARGDFCARLFGPIQSEQSPPAPVVFFVHGAGMSSMSVAPCANLFCGDSSFAIRCCSFDLRCHGDSTSAGGEESLSLENIVADVADCIEEAMKLWFSANKRFYLLGHSLGGSVVVHTAALPQFSQRVSGVAVLDVVEGTAKQSLHFMENFLMKRPATFSSVDSAVNWFVVHGGMHNSDSAALTVPSLLRAKTDSLLEWRTDLMKTAEQWGGWFEGLDDKFLSVPCPKMLCLAGTDRLDTAMTRAHMQGKFQLEVIGGGAGHYLLEDEPKTMAAKIHRFVSRIEVLTRKLPPPKKL